MNDITVDLTSIQDYQDLCYQFASAADFQAAYGHPHPIPDEGWIPHGDGVWRRTHPITSALARATLVIGIQQFTPENIVEVIYRLESVLDAGISLLVERRSTGFKCSGTPVHLPDCGGDCGDNIVHVPHRFTVHEVIAHVGLCVVEATTFEPAAFDAHVRSIRMQRLQQEIAACLSEESPDPSGTTSSTPGSGS